MSSKRTIITLLAGLNVVLLLVLFVQTYSLPTALGQARGRVGDYAAVTCRVRANLDVLYVLDVPTSRLLCFEPEASRPGAIRLVDTRDLKMDFNR